MKMMMMEPICFHIIVMMMQRYKNYFKRKRNLDFFINSACISYHDGYLYTLTFSYKLQEGIARNMNASFLMRKMGITE